MGYMLTKQDNAIVIEKYILLHISNLQHSVCRYLVHICLKYDATNHETRKWKKEPCQCFVKFYY